MTSAVGGEGSPKSRRNVDQITINSGNELDLDPSLPQKPSFGPKSSRTCNVFFQKTVGKITNQHIYLRPHLLYKLGFLL